MTSSASADLSEVWVETAVYDFDAPWVHLGAAATMKLSYDPGRTFDAKVSFVDPTLNERTRTLRVRLEVPNPGLKLKPGMFATVDIKTTPRTDAIIIPTEAVIRSGSREVVFVVHQLGHYEARQITTGVSGADYETQVLAGLKPGERVVTSGQFLLDSESQLREAVAKMSAKGLEQPPAKEKDGGAAHANANANADGGSGSGDGGDMKGMKMDHGPTTKMDTTGAAHAH